MMGGSNQDGPVSAITGPDGAFEGRASVSSLQTSFKPVLDSKLTIFAPISDDNICFDQ